MEAIFVRETFHNYDKGMAFRTYVYQCANCGEEYEKRVRNNKGCYCSKCVRLLEHKKIKQRASDKITDAVEERNNAICKKIEEMFINDIKDECDAAYNLALARVQDFVRG